MINLKAHTQVLLETRLLLQQRGHCADIAGSITQDDVVVFHRYVLAVARHSVPHPLPVMLCYSNKPRLVIVQGGGASESNADTGNVGRRVSMPLWADGAPEALGAGQLHELTHCATTCRGVGQGCAVIVNPGGGYRILASDHEGLQVARWLNGCGIAAFVLRYRVGPDYATSVSLLDGQRAVRLVRSRAASFNIDANRIGMLGFSAGGHLALAVATNGDDGDAQAPDPIDRCSSREFSIPVYAVSNGVGAAERRTNIPQQISG